MVMKGTTASVRKFHYGVGEAGGPLCHVAHSYTPTSHSGFELASAEFMLSDAESAADEM
jgi:hypothetical protein